MTEFLRSFAPNVDFIELLEERSELRETMPDARVTTATSTGVDGERHSPSCD